MDARQISAAFRDINRYGDIPSVKLKQPLYYQTPDGRVEVAETNRDINFYRALGYKKVII